MSQAIKIGGGKKASNNTSQIPQSLPANFYRGYVPPKTPKINPIPEPAIDDLLDLPPPSKESVGLNLQAGSFSLNANKHPMSMPVHSGLMGPLKNRVNLNSNNNKNKPKNKNAHGAISEIKEDDAADDLASGFSKMQMQVGSLTAFQIIGGDNQSMGSSFADQDDINDNMNDNTNSNKDTNFSNNNNNNNNNNNSDKKNDNDTTMQDSGTLKSAQNNGDADDDNEDNDDDDLFDMDDDE